MPNTTSLTLTVFDLVFNQGGKVRTTSIKIAEAFNRRHNDVCRKVESLNCSDEFKCANFFVYSRLNEQNGEAYINAFNQMASQLRSAMPILPPSQYQLSASRLPNFYDSGWLPAEYERCQSETHWTYYIKFQIRPTGGKYCAKFELGVGGKGETQPWFSSSGAEFIDSGFYLEYRDIEELWENVRHVFLQFFAWSKNLDWKLRRKRGLLLA